jgi:cytidylate kinase
MVTAPEETRTARLAKNESIVGVEAAKKVADSDRARADYFRRFYKLDHETPENYDLTFNTEVVGIDQARAAILAIVRP